MSALSVVWVARERLRRLQNSDEDCMLLIRKLEAEMKKGEIEIEKAYNLDDQVERYCLQKTGINPDIVSKKKGGDNEKKPSNEQGSGSGQDPAGGEHNVGNFIRNRVSRVQDGAKNLKDKLTHKGKGQSEVSTEDVGIIQETVNNPADEQASVQDTTNEPAVHSSKSKWGSTIRAVVRLNPLGKQASSDPKEKIESTAKSIGEEMVTLPTSPGASQTMSTAATDFLSDISIPKEKCVGMMNEHIEKMETILLKNNGNKFIWICGTRNGVGKTTLARKLFDKSPKLLQHFDGRAWASVGQKFQARDVAAFILLQLSYAAIREKDIQPMAATEIMERLEEAQRGRRCLVVLDDVSTVEAWKTIQSAIALHKDTRIIITASLNQQDLDKLEKTSNTTIIHREPLKTIEATWELLENQLSDEDQSIAKDETWKDALDTMKEKIFSRCEGFPLAAIVAGGMMRGELENLLAGQKGELLDWLNTSSPDGNPTKSLQELLSLCYKQLPYLLKSCFLYLGLFPDDQVIPVEKLYLIWITEGVILEREGETRMVTAENYLKALAQRGLVLLQEEDTPSILKVKSCMLHPQVRKICILEGQKDGFIRLEKQTEESKGHQEKLQTKRKIAIDVERLQSILKNDEAKHIRALLLFCLKGSVGEMADLKDFELARLLDFDAVDFLSRNSPKSIDKLVHLRHLSFRGCNLDQLSCSFSKLSFLETLDLFVKNSGTVIIPNDLGQMSSLLHLYLPLSFKTVTGGKLKLNQLTKLETLENFHAGKCDVGDLEFLTNLRVFKGIADGDSKDVENMVEFVYGSPYLCNSALTFKNFDIDDVDTSNTVLTLLSTDSLLELEIEGYLGHIPTINRNIDSVSITKIVFNGSEFGKDPMRILGRFHHLRDLVLCNDAYLGSKMHCSEGSFPKLRSLTLSNLWSLEKLIVESGAMACLASLVVEHCRKFKISRPDLKRIPTLREIMIDVEIRD